jgi:hypothetical protein
MSEEKIEVTAVEEDNEPIYYKPRTLNLIATVTGILSWVVLAGFILVVVGQFINLQDLSQGASLTELIKEASARSWLYTNLALPLLNGLGLFAVMQAASVGLNALLEIDFNTRD